jgi:predicted RNase H-like nuclease (RuvC/YqgF family)
MMNCSICHRPHHAKKLPFLCAVDARNRLYESRIEYAQALIENEESEARVEVALQGRGGGVPRDQALESTAQMDRLRAEEAAARDRTSQIIAQADRLKSEVDAAQREIAAKKDAIARKKSELAAVSVGVSTRRNRQLEEAERSTQRLRYKWNRSADTMAATRAFLCEGSARLLSLRQVKKGSTKRYEIGGVEIFDLHAMNSKLSAW